MFQHLVNRFAVSSFSMGIHCSIVCDNIGEPLRVGCIDVGQQVPCLFGVVVNQGAVQTSVSTGGCVDPLLT